MSQEADLSPKTRGAGQVVFVLAALILSLLLLSQIRSQTAWVDGTKLTAQPRFWPSVALITMVLGFGMHAWRMTRRRPNRTDWVELRRWAEPLEYALWFMGFVWLVPLVGFLPMSIAFSVALTWRVGYRSGLMTGLAVVFAATVVVVFKGLLGVKIPGAAIYEYLPGALRSFFILYL
ncbi:tripartite tricarboxylate transporter TctB family protein [Mesobacterium sp. TK19101]|uniref:Tripartite tricarboxylate transporter TctB family protein n=1 Tax=Mesobacterium hydrothermale TaxID=3111907 RepID=A0ABU6HEC6_9RHOB|nr:tripartite tricarboxylate transporter TctB family protein [Mesobacterium sp. TK19101]MEC3860819.1 tripartite tricarboxylate transporter TctB family protein [Mesobacterium sp. TK19101]